MIRLVQYRDEGGLRRVGLAGEDARVLRLIAGYDRIYDLAQASLRAGTKLETVVRSSLSDDLVDYDRIIMERRVLPPLDHADPAHCIVSLTGLTHLGSAQSRNQMHATAAVEA